MAHRNMTQKRTLSFIGKALIAIKTEQSLPPKAAFWRWAQAAGWSYGTCRWRTVTGVDPSQPMLDLAAQRLQSAGSGDRVALHHAARTGRAV